MGNFGINEYLVKSFSGIILLRFSSVIPDGKTRNHDRLATSKVMLASLAYAKQLKLFFALWWGPLSPIARIIKPRMLI